MSLLYSFLIGFLIFQSAFAGTPDQDPKVRKLRALFYSAQAPAPDLDVPMPSSWNCTSHDAFRDDFYSEPDMTFQFSREPWEHRTFSNHGSIIFKDLEFTSVGIQSIKAHPAYCKEPVYLTLRPIEARSGILLIGEVSVENRALPAISRYYGYRSTLTGVPSALSAERTVYYYLVCSR